MRTISRRSLIGGSAVTIAGAGALVAGKRRRGRRLLHGVGILDGPDADPPDLDAPVEQSSLDSRHMRGDVGWAIATPVADVEAVVLCLHGRGETHSFAFDAMGVHQFVAGEELPWAVVAVDGGASSYWHERDDGTDAQAMIFEELLPVVRERVGGVPIVLLGWSMGGYGALLAASDHPGKIAAVAAAAPALWPSFAQAASGAFDDEADFRRHDLFQRVRSLSRLPVHIYCGEDDRFSDRARAFADELPGADTDFGSGFHDVSSWRSRLPSQLEFFRRSLDR